MSAPSDEKVTPAAPVSSTIVIRSELDSYISERMKEQPQTLTDVVSVSDRRKDAGHRLQLPEYFNTISYDNTQKSGPYIFKWILKQKRSIDEALNAKGWIFVNTTYFPSAPPYLFTANGGVEIGDAILMFMPAKKALELRERPGKISRERMKSRMVSTGEKKVLMTGNPQDPNIYEPKLTVEESEESGEAVGLVPDAKADFS